MKITNNFSVSEKLLVGTIRTMFVCAAIASALASVTPNRAQSQQRILASKLTAPATTFEYEVASIKPNKSSVNGGFRFGMRYTDDGLSVENYPLLSLIQQAYGVNKDRISGAPDWLNSERYDIEAKMDGAVAEALKKLSPAERETTRQHMLQALLADRFKLTLHREDRELPVYNLVIAKNGPKLQETKPNEPNTVPGGASPNGSTPGVGVSVGGGRGGGFGGGGGLRTSSGKGATIESMLATLSAASGRPVLDKTGLTGKYDYKLQWAPEDSQAEADSAGPSIFTAVQEQLGLKLESAKGPVEFIVIDHVEKASGN